MKRWRLAPPAIVAGGAPSNWLVGGIVTIVGVAMWIAQDIGTPPARGESWNLREHIDGWLQRDANEYLHISQFGYDAANPDGRTRVVWFPGFALAIRGASRLADPATVAVALTLVAGMGSILGVRRWALLRGRDANEAAFGALLLAVFPYAWFLYGAPYSTALFLAATVAAFICIETGHPAWAALVLAVVTVTHPLGLAVLLGAQLRHLERIGVLRVTPAAATFKLSDVRRIRARCVALRPRHLVVSLGLGGVVGYSVFLGVVYGSPLGWLTGQSQYHGSAARALLKVDFFGRFLDPSDPARLWTTLLQAAFLAVGVVLLPHVVRTLGYATAAYVVAVIAFPVLRTDDFQGAGRYLLMAFPLAFAAASGMAGSPSRRWAWVGVSAVGLVVMSTLAARGWYLS